MNHLFSRSALAGAILIFLLGAKADQKVRPGITTLLADSRVPITIACFGDSVTGVYYHTGGRRAWCDMLGIALKRAYPRAQLEMVNAGVSGDTTFDGLKRIQADVLAKRPNLVVVMFGMNDVARVSLADYQNNLAQIVKECRSGGAKVILCTPNLIYAEDPHRPMARLAEFADAVRRIGAELRVPVADCYRRFEAIRSKSNFAWMALMSETIHPNMRGHIVIAEEVLRAITGKRVSLGDVPPPFPIIPNTLSLLSKHALVRVLAMPPYDRFIGPALREISPDTHVDVTTWTVEGKSLAEIEEEGTRRNWLSLHPISPVEKPDLVITAIPSSATAPTRKQFYRSYNGILNSCFSFAGFEWDVLAILPSVAERQQTSAQSASEMLALEAIKGHDIGWIARAPGDSATEYEIFSRWLRSQAKASHDRQYILHASITSHDFRRSL